MLACITLLPHAAIAAERPALTVPRASGPLRIDGVLDEAAWGAAGSASAFELMSPREGQAPDESTTVRVLRDGERVVFGIWCQSRRAPHAGLAPRDQVLDGDHISLHLDTDGDGQRAYIFGVNPWGVQVDGILTADPDFKWDGVWEAATKRGTGEWSAEIAVPFRILRVSAKGRPWRLWVRRELTAWNEVASWPLYRVGQPGPIMLQAGDLGGLDDARGGRELTVEPYVFGARTSDRGLLGSGGTSAWSDETQRDAGVDVQASVTRSLVVNATYNPDFSQIEADALQIDVNRRFPLHFPEKRPFFLEGLDHFVSLMDLVETRRMADPDWGVKLTGRAGKWNTGTLVGARRRRRDARGFGLHAEHRRAVVAAGLVRAHARAAAVRRGRQRRRARGRAHAGRGVRQRAGARTRDLQRVGRVRLAAPALGSLDHRGAGRGLHLTHRQHRRRPAADTLQRLDGRVALPLSRPRA